MRFPAWLSGSPGTLPTWLAACLLMVACGESSSPPESVGQIRVTSSTTGDFADPDGYTVVLDEGAGHPIPINGTLLLDEVPPGSHALTLTGVATNCLVPEQPATIVVNAGETTDASFTVTCDAATALAFRLVSNGSGHTCGVTTEDEVYCWGSNYHGQLGIDWDGPEQCDVGYGIVRACSSRPVAVLGGLRFLGVSTGSSSTCGVTTDNRAYCWGYNGDGQLGDGTISPRFAPVPVAGGLSFRQVTAGVHHTCGVTTHNRAYCWGSNWSGQLGDGTQVDQSTPVAVAGALRFRQVSADGHHTCGITTDSLAFCWGANSAGQLGDSMPETRFLPARVAGGHYFSQIDAGGSHTCAVTTGSRAFCWGQALYGQLGNREIELTPWPTAVAGGLSFDRVTAGVWHTCGQTTDTLAYCWGVGASGQLGNGTMTGPEFCDAGEVVCSPVPVAVVGGHSFAQVDVGDDHTCARTGANVAYCWGSTSQGRLGNGERDYGGRRATPTPVVGPL